MDKVDNKLLGVLRDNFNPLELAEIYAKCMQEIRPGEEKPGLITIISTTVVEIVE